MQRDCDACQGIEPVTPQTVANRPGLPALRYRAGTHGSFLESMIARLSTLGAEKAKEQAQGNPDRRQGQSALPPSTWLRSREPADPTIAMLDAWATVGDILTFYQERIANEGYLSTALERRSLHELANLVGYKLRPALSSSVYLAFDVQPPPALDREVPPAPPHEVLIPKGTQARHIPGPGELPQVFETKEDLIARPEWNQLKPRMTKPIVINSLTSQNLHQLRVDRLDVGLQPGDLLLFVCPKSTANDGKTARIDEVQTTIRRVKEIELDSMRQQTVIKLVDSPFSLVAYRDAIVRASSAYLTVSQDPSVQFPSTSPTAPGETPKLRARMDQWNSSMESLRSIAANDALNLLQTESEVHAAVTREYLYREPTWTAFKSAYSGLSRLVDGAAEDHRRALLTLFARLKGASHNPGWQAAFEALGRVEKCLVGDASQGGFNQAIRGLESIGKKTTAGAVRAIVTKLNTALATMTNTKIENVARQDLASLSASIVTVLGSLGDGDAIGDNVADKIKGTITRAYGKTSDVTTRVSSHWGRWLSLYDPSNTPMAWLGLTPWTIGTNEVVDPIAWRTAAEKADKVADSVADMNIAKLAIGGIEYAFITEIRESREKCIKVLTDNALRLNIPFLSNIENADLDELRVLSQRFIDSSKSLTDCVNAALTLVLSLENRNQPQLKYQINHSKVSRHYFAAEASQNLFVDASKPAMSAVLSILADLQSRKAATSDTHKYIKGAIIPSVSRYDSSSENVSRLANARNAMFLKDRAGELKLDRDYLERQLAEHVFAGDIPELSAILAEIDDSLKTKAPSPARSPLRLGAFGVGLGSTGTLLSEWQKVDTADSAETQSDLSIDGDIIARMMTALRTPGVGQLVATLKSLEASGDQGHVFSFSSRTGLFGASAPHDVKVTDAKGDVTSRVFDPTITKADDERKDVLFTDQEVTGVVAGGWCLEGRLSIDSEANGDDTKFDADLPFGSENLFRAYRVLDASHLKRDAYEQTGKTTRIQLDRPWMKDVSEITTNLRSTLVYSASRELKVVDDILEAPYPDNDEFNELELDEYYPDLPTGRAIQISGEVELDASSGISEPVRTGVTISHETLLLSADSQIDEMGRFKTNLFISPPFPANRKLVRSTVRIYANVVEATNGSTVEEVIGNGEGQGQFQRFLLSQPRLTYLPAETPTGMKPELEVRVNSVEWDQAESVGDLQPVLLPGRFVGGEPQRTGLPRKYLTSVDDDQKTFLTTGDGLTTGERLPTGITNVRATYRVGGGKGGNVKEGTITQLASPPLNVTKVRNLMPASGGVDRENVDQARKNLPVSVMALDRLVSVADYESFARKFAGIAKAQATLLQLDGRDTVVVTIAALDDQEIDKQSLLFKNLDKALRKFADPEQAVIVEPRELMLLMTKARFKVSEGYRFEDVKVWVRDRILKRFDFEKAQLGESVLLSDLIETIQNTRGVRYVDVDMFDRMRQFYGTGDMVRKAACIAKSKSPKSQIKCGSARIGDIDVDEVIFSRVMKDNSAELMTLKEQIESLSGFKKDSQATLGPPGSSPPKVEDHFVSAILVQSPETAVTGLVAPITEETQVSLRIFEVRDDALRRPPNSQPASQASFPAQLAYFTDLAGTILLEEIK